MPLPFLNAGGAPGSLWPVTNLAGTPYALSQGVGGIIQSIFADGTDGFYFDFSKTDWLFQNLTGTPADDAGENIALALDAHSWAGRTYAQELASRPPVLVDDFSTYADTAAMLAAGWAGSNGGTPTLSSGQMKLTNGLAAFGRVSRPFTTVAGRTYKASVKNNSPGGANLTAATASNLSGSLGTVALSSGASGEITFVATGTTTYVGVQSASSALAYEGLYDDFRVDLVPGNHGLQATTAAQPKWQTGGLARFDGSDDNLLTTLAPSASGTSLMFKVKLTALLATDAIITGSRTSLTDNRVQLGFDSSEQLQAYVGGATKMSRAGSLLNTVGVAALVFDGAEARLYWSNVLAATLATTVPSPVWPFALGANNTHGTLGAYFPGDLYYALAIKKALTAAEIAAITNLWGTS